MRARLLQQQRGLCRLDETGERALETAVRGLGLSARTIADLSGQEQIQSKHVAEAVQYRGLDRNYWSQVPT